MCANKRLQRSAKSGTIGRPQRSILPSKGCVQQKKMAVKLLSEATNGYTCINTGISFSSSVPLPPRSCGLREHCREILYPFKQFPCKVVEPANTAQHQASRKVSGKNDNTVNCFGNSRKWRVSSLTKTFHITWKMQIKQMNRYRRKIAGHTTWCGFSTKESKVYQT